MDQPAVCAIPGCGRACATVGRGCPRCVDAFGVRLAAMSADSPAARVAVSVAAACAELAYRVGGRAVLR